MRKNISNLVSVMMVAAFFVACGGEGGGEQPQDIPVQFDAYDPGRIDVDAGVQYDIEAYDPGRPDIPSADEGVQPDDIPPEEPVIPEIPPPDEGVTYDEGVSDDPGLPPVDETCKEYYMCLGNCPQGDQACYQECNAVLSPVGAQRSNALMQCLQQHGCLSTPTDEEFAECLEEYCISEYFMCFQGDTYRSCYDLIGCIISCPEDNPNTTNVDERMECVGNCWSEATYDAQMDLQNLINCAQKECASQCEDIESPQCDQCWNQVLGPGGACESYYDKCTVYGPEGCYYLLTCLNNCPAGDTVCQQACVEQTSKQGIALYNAIYDCIMQACPICQTQPDSPECDTCFSQVQQPGGACRDALEACLSDRPYGTKKCGELMQCLNTCQTDEACQQCFLDATKTANELFEAMIECALNACQTECQDIESPQCNTCINEALNDPAKCKDKFDACMNDQATE